MDFFFPDLVPFDGGVTVLGSTPLNDGVVRKRVVSGYSVSLAKRLLSGYGERAQVKKRVSAPYTDLVAVRKRVSAPYTELGFLRTRFLARFNMLEDVSKRVTTEFSILDRDPLAARNLARYTINSGAFQSLSGTPTMLYKGETLGIVSADISCDEGSPVWICDVEMARIEDYARLGITDFFELDLGVIKISFIVDGKSFKRRVTDDSLEEVPRITGSSPLTLMDAPFAMGRSVSYSGATSARSVVEDQIGPVLWNVPDWIIPDTALTFEGATPLEIARKVLGAVGALVESDVDGTPICRRTFPISIPDYDVSIVEKIFLDSDILGVDEVISPSAGYNRVSISNGTSNSAVSLDTLEQVPVEGSSTDRLIRAYLSTNRPVVLVHTGNPATVIDPLGLVYRSETERVEFKDGRASTRYKIKAITTKAWHMDSLGSVSFDGNNLYSDVPSYTLLDITYVVESLDFMVKLESADEVQFYLADLI